jgi:S-DNA-T family DNA segregation ATPase FtsK/SpoIIIE
MSEFVGVALFAAALIWIVALASYEPADAVWFFSSGSHAAPVNFAGRVGAFLAEFSFQLFGYASYLIPAAFVIIGWHYFWCRAFDAAGTKATGATLLVAAVSTFMSLVFGTVDVSGKAFRAGGYTGDFLAREMSEYFARTGSLIIILTLIFLAIIMSTQFSFGRVFGAVLAGVKDGATRGVDSLHAWREERRREKQRREVIAKHMKKNGAVAEAKTPPVIAGNGTDRTAKGSRAADAARSADASRSGARGANDTVNGARGLGRAEEDDESGSVKAPALGSGKPFAPPRPPKVTVPPPLPIPDPESTTKAPAERRKGEYVFPPLALLDAPKTERKIDERELMDSARLLEEKCREFAVEGAVVQIHPGPVVTTFEFKPDAGVKYSKITGLADDLCLAMQAESVLIDRIPGKSTVGIQIPNPNSADQYSSRSRLSLREPVRMADNPWWC